MDPITLAWRQAIHWNLNQSIPFRVIIWERIDSEKAAFTGSG
jgi:hypothetical protein